MALSPFRASRAPIGNAWFLCLVLASCAAPPKPAQAPVLAEEFSMPALSVETEVAPVSTALTIPSQCGDENAAGICGPPIAFVKDVCGGSPKPDLALSLFAKSSPWTRAYLRLNVEAWYTGSRSSRVGLKLDEEVIVMHHPNSAGGIIVNGGGERYDVMRLDGHCATLSAEEVTLKRPPAPKHPTVPWKQLDARTRDALLSDPAVAEASTGYEEGCAGGATACAKAGGKLTLAILDFVSRGGKIPLLVTQR
jgi:hypothetical protein